MYFIFDRFELDRDQHQLIDRDADLALALRPQAFSVLEFLLERAPATVSRDELLKGVWGHTALSPSGVSQAIREIRKTLGDDAIDPQILATRHGCGYQIITPVQRSTAASSAESAFDPEPAQIEHERLPDARQRARISRHSAWIAATLAVAPLAALILTLMLTDPAPRSGLADADGSAWTVSGRHLPRSGPASDAWAAGLQARARLDHDQAVRRFEQAWSEAPDSTSVLLALINAKVDTGEFAEAGELLNHKLLIRARLSHRERLELRATVARVAGAWSVAADTLQSLAEFFPSDQHYALWLFDARMHSARPERAAAALNPWLPVADPATALAMTDLAIRQGRLEAAVGHANTALELARIAGADVAGAFARTRLAGLLLATDDHEGRTEAALLLQRAVAPGESVAASSVLLDARIQRFELAVEQNQASAAHAQMAAVCADTAQFRQNSECARLQAILALTEGRFSDARSGFEQAAEGYARLGWTEKLAETRRFQAELELRLGQLAAATARLEEADQLFRQIGATNQLARSLTVRGDVLMASLQYPNAIEHYQTALRQFQEGGDRHAAAHTLARLAAVLPLVGQYDSAELAGREAADHFRAIDDERGLATLDRASARAALRTGDLDGAAQYLLLVEQRYARLGDNDARVETLVELARLHTERLELNDAAATLQRARELAIVNPPVRAQMALAVAELAIVEGDLGSAAEWIAAARAGLAQEGTSVQMHRVDLTQARWLLESGDAEAAERICRRVLEAVLRPNFTAQAITAGAVAATIPEEDHLTAAMLLAQTLVDQQRLDEARWTLDHLVGVDRGRVAANLGLRLQLLQVYVSGTGSPMLPLREVRDLALGQGFLLLALESDALLASSLQRNDRHQEAQLLADTVSRQARASGAICVVDYLARLRIRNEL